MLSLIERFKNVQIFAVKPPESSVLNGYKLIPPLDWLTALKSTEYLTYEPWMCAFVAKVFTDCGWLEFGALAAKSFPFAKTCLQPFIKLLLANNLEQHLESLCRMLDYFFEGFASPPSSSPKIFHNKRAIKKFLHICECIRIVNNWSIPMELENVVMASNHCQAYFLSIMYLEVWAGMDSVNHLANESFQAAAKKVLGKAAYLLSLGYSQSFPNIRRPTNPLAAWTPFLAL